MISELVTIILFRQHLKRNESSCGKQTLILENLPDELVPLLLQYIYLGWVEVSTSYHKIPTGFSSEIGTKLRESAVGQAGGQLLL